MQCSQQLTDRKTQNPTNKFSEDILFKEISFVSLQKLQSRYRKGLHQELHMQIYVTNMLHFFRLKPTCLKQSQGGKFENDIIKFKNIFEA